MTLPTAVRRTHRVRHELVRRAVEVRSVTQISPHFVSITFRGESLASFASDGFDDHVKFMFDDGGDEPVKRDYTPRRFDRDARELTIEFVLHGHGAASEWARVARPGMQAVIGGPKSSMVIPKDYPWHLLVGDATALPAIHRRLEELPQDVRAIVAIQLDDAADWRDLTSSAALDLHWLATGEGLLAHVRSLDLPEGDGFAWGAGEGDVMARLRDVILQEKGHPLEALRFASYWKRGEDEAAATD